MRFLNSELLSDWLRHGAIISNVDLSKDFYHILSDLPWLAGHLDFNKFNRLSISLSNLLNDEGDICFEKIYCWLSGHEIIKAKYIAFWYSEDRPCIICDKDFGLVNIDSAYWGVPGWNYMFGCVIVNGVITANYNEILCYDSANTLALVRNVSHKE
ncbi:hypothetical protein ACM92K_003338 [Cronobacter turicensis]|uniref:hypothetical protein n=1 Tax=Cronobacter TaxID=413496 RepID=UPI0013EA4DF8|nr:MULTISPECIES: hypothetical protein [unclassified Cronobacter]ELQ6223025.1 hypothetical protein [Cronobacter turicensis]ELQ6227238.1 hypothetical protein [Cronobacter turicensis]KAF6591658.1 hypothetical protein G9G39_20610 [Cronobacter sp. EKM101R]KAF6594022.1 hypothetical protein G9G38_19745 [Cronobacter sp. EKM102R]